jgi:hypothetical protein
MIGQVFMCTYSHSMFVRGKKESVDTHMRRYTLCWVDQFVTYLTNYVICRGYLASNDTKVETCNNGKL